MMKWSIQVEKGQGRSKRTVEVEIDGTAARGPPHDFGELIEVVGL
jgi:hypothetical protein